MATTPPGLTWGEVTHRTDRVVILAQGPSFALVDLDDVRKAQEAGAYVIAVNQAIRYYRTPDAWFTLDPSAANRAEVAQRLPGVAYYMAAPPEYGTPAAPVRTHRKEAEPWVTYLMRLTHRVGLADHPARIHSHNSGWGALGLAYHMQATRVVLLGIDGFGDVHWDGTRNNNLDHLPKLFRGAVPQLKARGVEVVNGSPLTAVDCFPVMDPAEALAWLVA